MPRHRSLLRRLLPYVFLLALVVPLGTAGCGEVAERRLCRENSELLCGKWFSCFPVASMALWVSQGNCQTVMFESCDKGDWLVGCDIDNDKLRSCNSSISASSCGQLPSSCQAIYDCYSGS